MTVVKGTLIGFDRNVLRTMARRKLMNRAKGATDVIFEDMERELRETGSAGDVVEGHRD